MNGVILKATKLRKYFYGRQGALYSFHSKKTTIKAVDGVDIEVRKGQIVAIIGESGCGKTTLAYTLARLYHPSAGEIWFDGEDITNFKEADLKRIRRKMQMVFQDPGSSLNPRQKIESIIALPVKIHFNLSKVEIMKRVTELLDLVHLPRDMALRHPPALSGGEKQRVGIARALASNPKLIILDEPTSSLDVSVQAKILHLLRELQQHLQLTYLLVTHNLSLGKNLADQTVVMYLGRIVEKADTETIFRNPAHPYTKALLSAIPVITQKEKCLIPEEIILEGELPSAENIPRNCSFLSRCQEKKPYCKESLEPDLKEVGDNHFVRCFLS